MTDQDDRWADREKPVLRAIVAAFERGDDTIDHATLTAATELPSEQVSTAVANLERGSYVTVTWMFSGMFMIADITERALRTTGIWPSADGPDALVDALRQAEDLAQDPEEKTLIRRAAGAVGAVSRDVMVDVTAAIIARQSGIG